MALQRAWTYLPLSPHHQLQIPKSGRGESSDACFSYLCRSLRGSLFVASYAGHLLPLPPAQEKVGGRGGSLGKRKCGWN